MPASLNDFIASLESDNTAQEYSFTGRIEHQIPVYDGHRLRNLDDEQMRAVQREWAECWLHGVGIIAISDFYAKADSVDAMTRVFLRLIEREQRDTNAIGDHFAGQGANKRLWNALEKAAVEDPQVFIDYYQNPLLGAVAEAWLGPGYQVTAQVNLVPPGSSAQAPHRDYHLGFQTDTEVERYPLHVQTMSAFLSLQGAVAHADMPVESGPTRVLPHSQRYELGISFIGRSILRHFSKRRLSSYP
jgi:ectoine hydroxylase-related dioxygenase (phytanoyl-CoA dioxygenase family)